MKSGSTIQYTQHYVQGIEYRQGASGAPVIEAIYHPEGRVFYTSATASRYEYSIRDHLGNTRLTFSDLNGNNKVDVSSSATTNEVLQENHYYPFGLGTNGAWMNSASSLDNLYQYNGKELNNDWGLNLYDYGFRWSDQALGRFVSVDPLAESYPIYATYQYAGNNPIGNIDLDELEPGGQLSPEMQQTLNEAQQAGAEPLNPSPAGTISERKTTRLERWRDNVESGKAGFISRMAYHMVNDVWVGAQDMTPGIDRPRNMGGGEVSGSERQNGAVGFLGSCHVFFDGRIGKNDNFTHG